MAESTRKVTLVPQKKAVLAPESSIKSRNGFPTPPLEFQLEIKEAPNPHATHEGKSHLQFPPPLVEQPKPPSPPNPPQINLKTFFSAPFPHIVPKEQDKALSSPNPTQPNSTPSNLLLSPIEGKKIHLASNAHGRVEGTTHLKPPPPIPPMEQQKAPSTPNSPQVLLSTLSSPPSAHIAPKEHDNIPLPLNSPQLQLMNLSTAVSAHKPEIQRRNDSFAPNVSFIQSNDSLLRPPQHKLPNLLETTSFAPNPSLIPFIAPVACTCQTEDFPTCKKENILEKLDRTMCRLAEEYLKLQLAKLKLPDKKLKWIAENPNLNHPVRCTIILNKRRSCRKRNFW